MEIKKGGRARERIERKRGEMKDKDRPSFTRQTLRKRWVLFWAWSCAASFHKISHAFFSRGLHE